MQAVLVQAQAPAQSKSVVTADFNAFVGVQLGEGAGDQSQRVLAFAFTHALQNRSGEIAGGVNFAQQSGDGFGVLIAYPGGLFRAHQAGHDLGQGGSVRLTGQHVELFQAFLGGTGFEQFLA